MKTDEKKTNRYKLLRKLLELAAPGWNVTQINFTIGVRGSILTPIFGKVLSDLGVPASSQALTVRHREMETQ